MDLKRRTLRHVDQVEFEHFVKYGEPAYGLTKQEIRGYDQELGTTRAFDSIEHSYSEDFYFDVIVEDQVVGRVLLLKMGHYFQLDLMIFDSYSGNGYGTKAVQSALHTSNVLEVYEVRARVLPTSPHEQIARKIFLSNDFQESDGYFVKGRRKRYSLQRPD
ncbi:GNAT family N-acetyltransferase [Exiguobacterium oxidotolerans]|uniref:GNAT family N-acetyltransferase n=1 Tax=Exiguobacterium oxidotolerans TaxID=223958 RepID=A0A653I6H0_9BACL|nr:GNAT family N-acetyltransferase [Exiguobacterium oxidotolerans]VWX34659.1 GNAT family N-acetyltransferase [Exiguobacterium oxidotolerans]